jgi:hypothetical protein
MTKTRFLTVVMALALLLAIPTAVFAQRVPPHIFVGTVTLDGAIAADGAAVTAWVAGAQVASTTASGGEYNLLVDQNEDSFAGETVSFKVSGANAAESATWAQGGGDVLNLVATTGSGVGGGEAGAAGASGAKGATGAKGAKGDTGAAGAAGAAGPAGADGAAGPAGTAGSTGTAGSAGAAGPAGEDGSGGGLGVIALIVAIVALLAAGGSYMMGRRA